MKFFWARCLHLKCFESATLWFYPKFVLGSVQVLIQVCTCPKRFGRSKIILDLLENKELELIAVKLNFRVRITARYPSSCNFYGLYGIIYFRKHLFIFFWFLYSFTTIFILYREVDTNLDKWLNTVNANYPPAPSGSPTQSLSEGAGGLLVYSYLCSYSPSLIIIRNTWEY